jgi:hypothetical protein
LFQIVKENCSTKSFQTLQQSEIILTYNNIVNDIKNEISDEEKDDLLVGSASPLAPYSDIVTEVKIEQDNTDYENDLPLSEVKKEIKKVKHKKHVKKKEIKTKPQKRQPLNKKYEGKIAIVNLCEAEMMEERNKLASKESYLKLPYKCLDCITGFDHEETLQDHLVKRHGEVSYLNKLDEIIFHNSDIFIS